MSRLLLARPGTGYGQIFALREALDQALADLPGRPSAGAGTGMSVARTSAPWVRHAGAQRHDVQVVGVAREKAVDKVSRAGSQPPTTSAEEIPWRPATGRGAPAVRSSTSFVRPVLMSGPPLLALPDYGRRRRRARTCLGGRSLRRSRRTARTKNTALSTPRAVRSQSHWPDECCHRASAPTWVG